ncbi:MAG: hypothetical protein KAG91_01545 [Mycoplasmataceae bacterium]|nr:hypothetical protein [Mycoplasmataceae bacterium]
MSSVARMILAFSIPVALVIMFGAWIIMKKKISDTKVKAALARPDDITNPALKREDHGQLLWDEKKKAKRPLADNSMELCLNTAVRNKFKTYSIKNFIGEYEIKTLEKKAKLKKVEAQYDFMLVNFNKEYIEEVDEDFKKLNKGGMIVLVNTDSGKDIKKLIKYLKLIGIRHDVMKVNAGVLLIAK